MSTRRMFASIVAVVGILIAPGVFEVRPLPPAMLMAGGQFLPISGGVAFFHGSQSSDSNQARRAGAHALAQAINQAQSGAVSATGRYVELTALPNLPAVPDGFALRFYTDGDGYVVSLKDTFDPCRYGVFTDQQNRLYESSPQIPQLTN
jgi:hypothetical protein